MERRVASAMVMMLQVAVVAVIVGMVSFWLAPEYKPPPPVANTKQPGDMHKARGGVWMAHTPNGRNHRVRTWKWGMLALDPPGMPEDVEAIKNAIHTRSTAKEVIRRLDLKMTPAELLDNLAIETEKDPGDPGPRPRPAIWVERTYKDTDRERAEQILDMVGQVAFESNNKIGYQKSKVFIPVTPPPPPPPNNALKNGLLTLAIGWALCLLLKRREFMYAFSNRGAVRDATYYLWGKGYAYYLSLSPTISAKATTAVGLFVAVALSVASMVGGGGSKPAPFD
jgi:hypothetical protein